MPKKDSLFETVLGTLSSLARLDAEGQVGHLALVQVHCIEKMLKKAPLSKTERVRADAALYKVLSVVKVQHREPSTGETFELPVPGDSPADVQLRGLVQVFEERRAKRQESAVAET